MAAETALLLDLKLLYHDFVVGNNRLLYEYIRRSDRSLEHDLIVLRWLETSKGKSSEMYLLLQDESRRLDKLIYHKKNL